MAKSKKTITELIVLANPDECGSCARAKKYIDANKDVIKDMGINKITILNPDDSKRGKNLSDDILGVGVKAQPLFVVKDGKKREIIPGFPKTDDRIPMFEKALKITVKRVKAKKGIIGRLFG
jgi:hypothetical protein